METSNSRPKGPKSGGRQITLVGSPRPVTIADFSRHSRESPHGWGGKILAASGLGHWDVSGL